MNGLLGRARAWIEDLPIDDPLQRRHAATLQLLALALCSAVVLLESVRALSGHASLPVMAINLVNGALALATIVALRRGHYHRGAILFVVGYGLVQATAFSLGGLNFSRDGVKNIGLVLTLAALLAGRRALWWMLAAFTAALGIAYARDLGFLGGMGPRPTPGTPGGIFWASVVSFSILALVLDRFGLTVTEALDDRRAAESALRTSEELFRVAFQHSPAAITLLRMGDGEYQAVNDAFTRMTGWRQEEVVGKTSLHLGLWEDDKAREQAASRVRSDGRVRDFEARMRRRDGTSFLAAVYAQRFELGGRPHLLAILRDVTAVRAAEAEKAQLEAQLLQAQKLESIGRLAGGVAHDLNNLLTAVLGYTDLLKDSLTTVEQHADLEQIRLGGQRAANLTRQLLSFARKQPVEPREVDVNDLIATLGGLVRRVIGVEIELVVRHAERPAVVLADAGQLEQVLLNLVVNARDAMAGRGRLTVEARVVEGVAGMQPGEYVCISVADTGSGMTAEVQKHLFEPFFTTKEPGKGTGLGLATCYGIVQQAKGQIAVDTVEGRGTTFRIYLPRLAGPCPKAAEAQGTKLEGGGETVLLVEDESQLRALASRVLREHGYRVLEAVDGVHAIEVSGGFEGTVDLLLTDVVMPRLGGRGLAAHLRASRPGMRVLFASGYSDSPADLAEQGLLQKPFTATALLQRVRQALD